MSSIGFNHRLLPSIKRGCNSKFDLGTAGINVEYGLITKEDLKNLQDKLFGNLHLSLSQYIRGDTGNVIIELKMHEESNYGIKPLNDKLLGTFCLTKEQFKYIAKNHSKISVFARKQKAIKTFELINYIEEGGE